MTNQTRIGQNRKLIDSRPFHLLSKNLCHVTHALRFARWVGKGTVVGLQVWAVMMVLMLGADAMAQKESPVVKNPEEPAIEPHRKGLFRITVEGLDTAILRQTSIDYRNRYLDLEADSFEQEKEGQQGIYDVHVPDTYDQDQPAGLIVWISPSDTGFWPRRYHELLKQHNLIVIGANFSGNKHSIVYRAGYALQAVKLMYPNYNLDPDRIYLTGLSGGGRVTATSMMLYTDVFAGGFPMIGANTVVAMTNSDSKGNKFEDKGLAWVPVSRVDDASKFGRYVFLTGEKDFNRLNVKTISNGYKKRQFKFIKYLEQPELGHQLPSAEYVDQAITWLDDQLPEVANARFEAAPEWEEQRPGKSHAFYETVIQHGQDAEQITKAKSEVERIRGIYETELAEIKTKLKESLDNAEEVIGQFAGRWNRLAFSDIASLKTIGK